MKGFVFFLSLFSPYENVKTFRELSDRSVFYRPKSLDEDVRPATLYNRTKHRILLLGRKTSTHQPSSTLSVWRTFRESWGRLE